MENCSDLQVYPISAVAALGSHAISDQLSRAQPTVENIRFETQSKSKHNEIRRNFDLTTTNTSDRNLTKTTKTDIFKRNKIIKKYISRRHSIKRSAQEGCALRNTIISKCLIRDKIIRLRTIKTDIITHDIVRSSTLIQKMVKTKTLKKDDFAQCLESMPLVEARKIIEPPIKL